MSKEMENGDKAADKGDYKTAFIWYLEAATNGDITGKLYLGYIYEHDFGTGKKDLILAEKYYTDAAINGGADTKNRAKNLLGCFYINSKPDNAAAYRWFEDAANNGYAPAQANLAFLAANGFRNGKGIPEEPLKKKFEREKNSAVAKTKASRKRWIAALLPLVVILAVACLFFAQQNIKPVENYEATIENNDDIIIKKNMEIADLKRQLQNAKNNVAVKEKVVEKIVEKPVEKIVYKTDNSQIDKLQSIIKQKEKEIQILKKQL